MRTQADVLRRARELIATPDRWIQGRYHHDGQHCVMGAVFLAARDLGQIASPSLLVACLPRNYRQRYFNDSVAEVIGYNDSVGRTHKQIMALLDCAIEKAESEVSIG